MHSYRQFLTEAKARIFVMGKAIAVYTTSRTVPRIVIAPTPSHSELKNAPTYTLVELPVIKPSFRVIPLPVPSPDDAAYEIVLSFMNAPSEENLTRLKDYAKKHYASKSKIQTISRKQLAAFLVKKQISTASFKNIVGDLSSEIASMTVQDIVSTPVKVAKPKAAEKTPASSTTAKPRRAAATKKKATDADDIPDVIAPFHIVYPARYKDKLGLSRLVKVAVVMLRKHGVDHLFDKVTLLFDKPKKKASGLSFGNGVVLVDPSSGYQAVTLTVLMHELWHWLEDRYPDLQKKVGAKRREIQMRDNEKFRNATGGVRNLPRPDSLFRFERIIDPAELIGKKVTFTVTGRATDAVGTIMSWSASSQTFATKTDEEHIAVVKKGGKIGTIRPVVNIPARSLVMGWSKIIGGPDPHKIAQSQWSVTEYSHTNDREFGAELFAWWSTSRLTGEPAAFMDDLLHSIS